MALGDKEVMGGGVMKKEGMREGDKGNMEEGKE